MIVCGAGIGGLCAAARLAHAGAEVTILDPHAAVGGKMRTLPTPAGPADAGPTVLTMPAVFEDLFETCGERLSDHLALHRAPLLARHFWPDGSRLDLTSDPETNAAAIAHLSGRSEAAAYEAFHAGARRLFEAFEGPMMHSAAPSQLRLGLAVARDPRLALDMAPHRTLLSALAARFADPRLRQLFGRYATYVGGTPGRAPALLGLIFHSEARGVWAAEGGMHAVARAVAALAGRGGARLRLGTAARRIVTRNGRAVGVETDAAERLAGHVVFAGDPRALRTGRLGPEAAAAVRAGGTEPRSLSADVWAFGSALKADPGLVHHNVFFCADQGAEWDALRVGRPAADPTLYVCAQDRAQGAHPRVERFEIIANAPPLTARTPHDHAQETARCRKTTFTALAAHGLTFRAMPGPEALTTPQGFEALSLGSAGSLYGRSPQGLTGSLARPRARSRLPGLYLAGGGTHPGAGVPMAALSGRHAAEAICADLTSISTSPRAAMAGGMSTGSNRGDVAAE